MNVMPRKELHSAEEMEARLREIGATRYHNLHPFHRLLHGGKLNKGQVQAWALNRYYYQSSIPIKDAIVISRFRDRELRREWIHRVTDHDGEPGGEGGIDRWLKLTDGLGIDRDYVESTDGILPATRFAVDAYVHFVRDRTPLEAVASSLTELFAPGIHEERISGMLEHYDFIDRQRHGLFPQAPRPGAARRRLRPRIRQGTRPHARGARGGVQRLDLQDPGAVGAVGRALPRLCRRSRPAGRFRPRGGLMAEVAAVTNKALDEDSRPVLPRYARLHFDKARDRWVLLVPERVLVPDETAVEILQLCDSERSIADIVDLLAEKYVADRDAISGDVISMLQDLAEKGFLVDAREEE